MILIRTIILLLALLAIVACSSSPIESTTGNTNKIPPAFKGTWQLERISCANGSLGPMAEFINANLNNNASENKLGLVVNQVQDRDVTSTILSGLGYNATVCTYVVTQHWEKTGHWLQASDPSNVKSGDAASEACETKKADFVASSEFKYILPVGEISIESKNGKMYLHRTLGRSEKDLEICKTSDRYIYELKKQGD